MQVRVFGMSFTLFHDIISYIKTETDRLETGQKDWPHTVGDGFFRGRRKDCNMLFSRGQQIFNQYLQDLPIPISHCISCQIPSEPQGLCTRKFVLIGNQYPHDIRSPKLRRSSHNGTFVECTLLDV